MKLIIDIDKEYYELLKYDVEHGQDFKPIKIIANGIPYEERPQGDWIAYRNDKCDRAGKCFGYIMYHCTGCNGAKEVKTNEDINK